MSHPILLYDGVCGLCNRFVQFILQRDAAAVFRFASLQSPLAARILTRHGADPADLDTVYVVVNYDLPDEHLLARSDAVIFVLKHLGARNEEAVQPWARPDLKPRSKDSNATPTPSLAFWRLAGSILSLIPLPVRDCGYRIVARNRYRIFGRYETCILPTPEHRDRFMD